MSAYIKLKTQDGLTVLLNTDTAFMIGEFYMREGSKNVPKVMAVSSTGHSVPIGNTIAEVEDILRELKADDWEPPDGYSDQFDGTPAKKE